MKVRRMEKSCGNVHRAHGCVRAACGLDVVRPLKWSEEGDPVLFPSSVFHNKEGHLPEDAQNTLEDKTKPGQKALGKGWCLCRHVGWCGMGFCVHV